MTRPVVRSIKVARPPQASCMRRGSSGRDSRISSALSHLLSLLCSRSSPIHTSLFIPERLRRSYTLSASDFGPGGASTKQNP